MHLDSLFAALPRSGPELARLVEGSYLRLSAWLAAELLQAGTLIAATLLSLFGHVITNPLRRSTRSWPFFLRTALFIAVVGLGFGLIVAAASPLVVAGLRSVGTPYLVPATLSAFIVIGILAERGGHI